MKEKLIFKQFFAEECYQIRRIMKFFVLLFFVGTNLVFADNVYSQKEDVNINVSNAKISKVLSTIEETTDYVFLISDEAESILSKTVRDIDIDKNNISKTLDEVFADTSLEYNVVGRQITVYPNENAKETPRVTNAKVEAVEIVQSTIKIHGKVIDKSGEALIGVSVGAHGTSSGTITNVDGEYNLEVDKGVTQLVFSYIGYEPQTIKISNRTTIDVTMSDSAESLDEVVVIGYGSLDKKQVTSSVASIGSKDLMVGVGGSDITSALQGRVSGLVIRNDGSVNAESTIQLRGMTSINSGKEPLVVIDGFPGGDIRSVSQEDIKSIDVLKDGSAGAIYGTRAASGVILITTKSGSNTNGRVKVSYSGEINKKQAYGAPKMLSGREYAERVVPVVKGAEDYGSDVDWWNKLLEKGNFSQKHNVSIDTGNENAQVFTSFFYEKQEGITINDSREDYGGRFKANFKLLDDWLEIRPNVDYRQADRVNSRPNFQQALRNNPTRSPYDANSQTGYNVWLNESLDYNVLADAKLKKYDGLNKWFKPEVTFKVNVKPVPGLSLQQVIGYENKQWEHHLYTSRYHREELQENRRGSAHLKFEKKNNVTSEGYATYIKDINGKHVINAVAGYSYFKYTGEEFAMTNRDFDVDGVGVWDIGTGTNLSDGKAEMSSKRYITEKLFSVFARTNYSYLDTYLLQASFRREGSSKFAKDNRWGNFWSLSGGWRISKENFMKDVKWVSDLKLRVGYGVTGNNNFKSSYMADMLEKDTYWMLPDGSWGYSYGHASNVNKNLGWEKKNEWDIGLDYELFNGRLYGKFDWYTRTVDDLIYEVKVPQPPFTKGDQIQNIGKMENKGWEFEVGGEIISTKDFTWSSNISMSHNSGKIKTLYGNDTFMNGDGLPSPGDPSYPHRLQEGAKIGAFYMWKFAGFDEKGQFLIYNAKGDIVPASEKKEQDRRYIGNYNPKLILNWRHTFTYKQFDLGLSFRSWINFDVLNTTDMYFGIQGRDNTNVLKDAYGKYNHIRGEKQLCDYYLQDGTFVKLDAITFGYTVPIKKYTKYIDKMRFYGTVGNVFTITGYKGMNPEVDITGWKGGIEKYWELYPQVRTFTLGMQLNF